MFNKRIGDDLGALGDVIQAAVAAARVPGQSVSFGNAAGAYSTISNVVPDGVFNSGTTGTGGAFFVCLTDVDFTDSGAMTE